MAWHRRLVQALLYGDNVDRDRKARARLGLAMLGFVAIYCVIAGKLVFFALVPDSHPERHTGTGDAVATARPDIVDRNGEVLATDVKRPSLFAEPRRVIDVDEASELLTAVMPDLDTTELRQRLGGRRGFAWLKREITPKQQEEVHRLGIPGIGFVTENKRIYPDGPEASHVLGYVNVDNQGVAGIENWLDGQGLADLHRAGFASDRQQEPVELALDIRVQHALRDELIAAREKYKAKASAGLIYAVRTGEVIAMASEPDYDPNNPREALDKDRVNRLTYGLYEMGSTFKAFTVAMALDSGRFTLNSMFDARTPLHYGRFTIDDYHAQHRMLSTSEVFTYSSNIGAAMMARAIGIAGHQAFLRKMGQLDRLKTELPESREPMVPKHWAEVNTATISFGHGLSVAPLQAVMGVAALMNGGMLIPPTFLKRSEADARALAKPVIKPQTSAMMRYLMRLNAEKGTATKADVPGYYVGAKTGTAEKVFGGHYVKTRLMTDVMAVLPADDPRYLVLVMLDEPQAIAETHGFATSGWNAVPVAAKVISRVAPLLGVEPRFELPPADRLILASVKDSR
ncbi:MAG TPA: penicillin-binding protein 2 [Xanthobacteraceae bacterium]|nr:penicillin-binding protein 2 [Xanthobacteraceae bacterium]